MNPFRSLPFALALALVAHTPAAAAAQVVVEHHPNDTASPAFRFQQLPGPSRNDAARQARFILVDGQLDRNGGGLGRLNDGQVPRQEDAPADSAFWAAGSEGGRWRVDLGASIDVQAVHSYSWHPSIRGPQVYRLYGSDGQAANFNPSPARPVDPATCGWQFLAEVDARPANGDLGGQYGVRIHNPDGLLGRFQHLLFDIRPTVTSTPFGHTFYGEIDVLDARGPVPQSAAADAPPPIVETIEAAGGRYTLSIDTTEVPDLTEWARKILAPVVQEWYPRIVDLLPSEGFAAPQRVTIQFRRDMTGVADTSGNRVRCAANWFRRNLEGEAKGAVVHELVHVVQAYGSGRRQPGGSRPPGWLVEGLADYLRFYLYEPETKGAEIGPRRVASARYDASYRVTANFIHWVVEHHDRDLLRHLNAALREGRYQEAMWKERTGKTVQELDEAWRADLAARATATP